ncbi:hypothetical protein VB834_08330 [Limnoraphis robusta Tam1]|uniref:hypothetical protein n=1 Tax=Limnoraphis robusta TaxID=1118279 RepID=UPI002B203920|nr:hypothetical protein [Limnoraphis robusta]MEA5539038.1 hypothetical protein [Limnoraphis robusta Tam1]
MSHKTLFCLGMTTLLAASFIPTMAARATTHLNPLDNLPFSSIYNHQRSQVSLEEYKSNHVVFASEETKSSGVPQDSSRPPRG